MPGSCQGPDKWKFQTLINCEIQTDSFFHTHSRYISGNAREDGVATTSIPWTEMNLRQNNRLMPFDENFVLMRLTHFFVCKIFILESSCFRCMLVPDYGGLAQELWRKDTQVLRYNKNKIWLFSFLLTHPLGDKLHIYRHSVQVTFCYWDQARVLFYQ